MFGLFRPRSPIDTAEKVWVEQRMLWLSDRLGRDRILDARVILPRDEFFPDPYQPDEPSVRRCLDRVCRYMRVDPGSLDLTVVADEAIPGAAGMYQRRSPSRASMRRTPSTVLVAASQLADPVSLIATLAHEVAHEILLGGGILTEQVADHEQITDLLTVFLGLGVFNANATLYESSWNYGGTYAGWTIGLQGYLSARVFGYALGVFSYVREEWYPKWARALRPDAKGALQRGLKYLRKTGDGLFRPDSEESPRRPRTASEISEGLNHLSPTFRLAALYDLRWAGIDSPDLVPAICRCLDDRDAGVRAEAVQALAMFGSHAAAAVPRLLATVQAEDDLWVYALPTLVALRAEPAVIVTEITRLLPRHPSYAAHLAGVLREYRSDATPAIPALVDAFGREVATGGAVPQVLAALRELVPDVETAFRERFADDPELIRLALWEMNQPIA